MTTIQFRIAHRAITEERCDLMVITSTGDRHGLQDIDIAMQIFTKEVSGHCRQQALMTWQIAVQSTLLHAPYSNISEVTACLSVQCHLR